MATVTRARRAQIQFEAAQIRRRCQRDRYTVEGTVLAIRTALPEVSALEAWRLALGWSRGQAIRQVGAEYEAEGLRAPSLSEPMLCRWEHDREQPGAEYREMICRAYGARPEQLELVTRCPGCIYAAHSPVLRYGRCKTEPEIEGAAMTTASGLPAVRETLTLALLDAPGGSAAAVECARAAVEHYAANYSVHPPQTLMNEVRAARLTLAPALTAPTDPRTGAELRRSAGWLSALLGNLAHHVGDTTGARAHLALAADLGARTKDAMLEGWARGALAMVATAGSDYDAARMHSEAALEHAPRGLRRAQLLGWALLPALAGLGRVDQADATLAAADRIMESADEEPGRFGYDLAEHRLHAAEAHLTLGRHDSAARIAAESITATVPDTPGWVAATLVLALSEAHGQPRDAAQRGLYVLDRVPPARLRATSRTRLARLDRHLAKVDAPAVRDLRERLQHLPPPIEAQGQSA